MTDNIPTATDCQYASQVLKEEAEFCKEQGDNVGALMLERVISVLDDIQEPLQQFGAAMEQGLSPWAFLMQWAASQGSGQTSDKTTT